MVNNTVRRKEFLQQSPAIDNDNDNDNARTIPAVRRVLSRSDQSMFEGRYLKVERERERESKYEYASMMCGCVVC